MTDMLLNYVTYTSQTHTALRSFALSLQKESNGCQAWFVCGCGEVGTFLIVIFIFPPLSLLSNVLIHLSDLQLSFPKRTYGNPSKCQVSLSRWSCFSHTTIVYILVILAHLSVCLFKWTCIKTHLFLSLSVSHYALSIKL